MPTGTALHDPRTQLFEAAGRVLARDGANALTSRAVTAEAGVAKGVLHRHFADFDEFLAELVRDHIARLESIRLLESAGTGTVERNLAGALTAVFESVAREVLALVTSRDGLRERLRETTPTGIPVLTEATAMIADYLAAEQALGRVDAKADVKLLALTLVGAAHLQLAGRPRTPADAGELRALIAAAL